MSNSWKDNNLLINLRENSNLGEKVTFEKNTIYSGSDENEYMYLGKKYTYKYSMSENPSDLALFGETTKLAKGFEIDGFHTTEYPLNVEVKKSNAEIDIFLTNMSSKPRIVTNKAKQVIKSSIGRKASAAEVKTAEEIINNNLKVTRLNDTPHIEYAKNSSNFTLFGRSLAQDSEGNIHSVRFNIRNVEFTIDGEVIDILDVNKIKSLKVKCDEKYMDDYRYGSSFLLSDMASRYGEAEREAYKDILDYLKNNQYKLVDNIYYTTEHGDKRFTSRQLESNFFNNIDRAISRKVINNLSRARSN